MSTTEKLFVQIFERKRWIIEHLKQQKLLYDQHLASKLLIQGITPPPWLLNPQFPSSTSDLTAINKEELISGLLLPQPGPLVAYPSGSATCFAYDKSVATAINDGLTHATCASSNGSEGDEAGILPSCHTAINDGLTHATCASSNGSEGDEAGILPSCHTNGTGDESDVVPQCHVDGTQNMANYVPMSPEDQTDMMNSSLCLKQEQSLARVQRSRSRQKALELRNSAKASGKCSLDKENNAGISSSDKAFGHDQLLEGIRKSGELVGPLALSTCINEEAALGDCTNREMTNDGCSDSTSESKGNEAKEVQTEDDNKKVQSYFYVGRNTRSNSYCPQSGIRGHQNTKKSHEVYIGRMTRSRSGKAQLSENDDPQNRRVTKSCSNPIHTIKENHATGNSKSNSGVISNSRSDGEKEAETKDHRSRGKTETKDHRSGAKNESRAEDKMSVKPKQLDFDELEEACLADSLAESTGNFKEKAEECNSEERSAPLPPSSSAEGTSKKCTSLAYETQDVFETGVVHSLPKSNKISGQTSLLLDCPPDSATEEHMLRIAMECATHPSLSGQNEDISIPQKRKSKSEEEQELDKEKGCISLHNADTEATMDSYRNTVEATFSLEKNRPEWDSCNDCMEASHRSLPCADTEVAMNSHPYAVEATLSLKTATHELGPCNDCKETSDFSWPNEDTEAMKSLPKDVEATLSLGKSRYDSGSDNDCKQPRYLTLPNADSEATMSSHRDAVEAHLSLEKTRHESSACNNCKEKSTFGWYNTDSEDTMSLTRYAVETTFNPEQSRHEPTSCNDFKAILETQTAELLPHSPGRNSGASLGSMLKFHPFDTPVVTRSEHVAEVSKPGSHFRNTGVDVLRENNVGNAMDGSWPCYKRRKIGYQVHYKSASPSLRVNTYHDVNENMPNKFLRGDEDNSISLLQKLIVSGHSDANFSNSESVATAADGLEYFNGKEPELAPKVQYEEDKDSMGRSATMPFTCEQKNLSKSGATNVKQGTTTEEPSDFFPAQEAREAPTSTVHCIGRLSNDLKLADLVGRGNSADKLTFVQTTGDRRESLREAEKLTFSIGSPLIECMDMYDSDASEIVPEFEGFIIAEKSDGVHNAEYGLLNSETPFPSKKAECVNLPGQIPRPVSLGAPASPCPTAYKLHFTPGVYRSVPNGLIENIDLTSNMQFHDNGLQGKSYSDYCSFPGKRLGRNITIPFISPLGKGFEGITSKSGSSGRRLSSNPELICFPIQEDSETGEEDVNIDDTCDTDMNGFARNVRTSSIRDPLRDITAMNETSLAASHVVERGSLESVATEVSISEKHDNDRQKNEMHLRSRQRRQERKENQSLSIGAPSIKKQSESHSSRHSKPKLLGKSIVRSRGQSLSEKESKCNNIVSNVKSFLPLVLQKQASAVIPAKREVKVKALEAAEAAKHLAEKKENERKQKKEALKLERARLEQENLKQMELKKKMKEEEKKKRDAENTTRKRQREEEDRKEKERKRKRIEVARCQQKQAEEKISAWREEARCEAKDGRGNERKNSNDKSDRATERENISRNPGLVRSDGRKADNAMPYTNDNKSSTGSSDTGKVGSIDVADISTPNCDKSDKPTSQFSQEQSYDISPYQCSDDEEEEDNVPNKKFIPVWASKGCVAVALSSLKQLDPDTIFPPGSFCSLEEVLLPRKLTQK